MADLAGHLTAHSRCKINRLLFIAGTTCDRIHCSDPKYTSLSYGASRLPSEPRMRKSGLNLPT